MKERVNVMDYAEQITKALPRGLLLNTNGEKFNSMVIGWGGLGVMWGVPAFTVYVRENRYTKAQLDRTGEFTVSVPLNGPVPEIVSLCGGQSGRNVDKAARLTLEDTLVLHTPGVREYPLTLECQVMQAQVVDLARLTEAFRSDIARMYPQDVDGSHTGANRDPHTAYIGRIVEAYVIR